MRQQRCSGQHGLRSNRAHSSFVQRSKALRCYSASAASAFSAQRHKGGCTGQRLIQQHDCQAASKSSTAHGTLTSKLLADAPPPCSARISSSRQHRCAIRREWRPKRRSSIESIESNRVEQHRPTLQTCSLQRSDATRARRGGPLPQIKARARRGRDGLAEWVSEWGARRGGRARRAPREWGARRRALHVGNACFQYETGVVLRVWEFLVVARRVTSWSSRARGSPIRPLCRTLAQLARAEIHMLCAVCHACHLFNEFGTFVVRGRSISVVQPPLVA